MSYLPLLQELDDWQGRAARAKPGVIPCRTGCAACCMGPFDISVADALLVREAVAALPDAERATVRRRAADQIATQGSLAPDWGPPYAIADLGEDRFDRVSETLRQLPCPLLDGRGRCLIYPARPMICRAMGLGMRTELGDVIENACPIQDRFPQYGALPPASFPLESWEAREGQLKTAAAERLFADRDLRDFETTIAGAILLDGATAGRGATHHQGTP